MFFSKFKKLCILSFSLLWLALVPTSLFSQIEFPNTPAGHRASEILTLINSADAAKVEKYVAENYAPGFKDAFPMDRHVGLFVPMKERHQTIELTKINSSSEYDIDFLLHSKASNAWLNVKLWVEEAEPYLISRMGIQPGSAPAGSSDNARTTQNARIVTSKGKSEPDRKITDEELTKFLTELINELVAKDEFSGTVLVARDGKPIFTRAVGDAHKGFKVPNQLDTKFNLGSMNKMFTGTAIMQLVQQGKLKLDDKVGKYLPDYPNQDVREKVTIHHLLTHTSGMGHYWEEYFQSPKLFEIKSVADYDHLANKNPLQFEPGERFSYSNCGPLVLGLIIEKISGMSYYDYIKKYIYTLAGMDNSDCYDISTIVENLAVGYTRGTPMGRAYDDWQKNLFSHPAKGGPAGGGYSTVEDLLKFDSALRANTLLDAEHFKTMTTGKINRNAQTSYAYLFEEKLVNGHRIVGHSGGAGGINSHLGMYMDLGYTVAIMSNYDPPAALNIARKLEELLTESSILEQ